MYGLANPAADAADKMKQPHDDKDPELPVVRWRAASIAASYSLATWVIVMRLQLLSHRILRAPFGYIRSRPQAPRGAPVPLALLRAIGCKRVRESRRRV